MMSKHINYMTLQKSFWGNYYYQIICNTCTKKPFNQKLANCFIERETKQYIKSTAKKLFYKIIFNVLFKGKKLIILS